MKLKKILSVAAAVAISVNIAAVNASAKGKVNANETVAKYFEEAKKNKSTLIAFLHQMPKGADLHNHFSATIEAEEIVKAAIADGLWFDRTTKTFVKPDSNEPGHEYYKTADFDPVQNTKTGERELIYAEILEAISMRNYELGDESGHDHFFEAFFRFGDASVNSDLIYRELFKRAYSEKIGYFELMKNPKDTDYASVEKYEKLYKDKYNFDISVNFIATVNRNDTMTNFKKNFDNAVNSYYSKGGVNSKVVGITLLSAEDDAVSQANFNAQMNYIDTKFKELESEKKPLPKMHIHGGELTPEYATFNSMLDRIKKTIELGHANIIGHGTSVAWEYNTYDLLKYMKKNNIGVSICPTSNEVILDVYGTAHPFKLYWDADIPIAISTDDEGLSRSNLTNEYAKIIEWFDLSYNEVKWLSVNSLEMSFLDGEGIFSDHDYNKYKPNVPELIKTSPKAKKEYELIENFNTFELRTEKSINELFK